MRNHHHKTRDMVRTALASKDRDTARNARRLAHKASRARQREMLHELMSAVDPDDVNQIDDRLLNNHLTTMVWRRQAHDNLSPVFRWVDRTIAADPDLQQLDRQGQVAYFAKLLGHSVAGEHAAFHIEFELAVRKTIGNATHDRFLDNA